jgi:hypothetical protein
MVMRFKQSNNLGMPPQMMQVIAGIEKGQEAYINLIAFAIT